MLVLCRNECKSHNLFCDAWRTWLACELGGMIWNVHWMFKRRWKIAGKEWMKCIINLLPLKQYFLKVSQRIAALNSSFLWCILQAWTFDYKCFTPHVAREQQFQFIMFWLQFHHCSQRIRHWTVLLTRTIF